MSGFWELSGNVLLGSEALPVFDPKADMRRVHWTTGQPLLIAGARVHLVDHGQHERVARRVVYRGRHAVGLIAGALWIGRLSGPPCPPMGRMGRQSGIVRFVRLFFNNFHFNTGAVHGRVLVPGGGFRHG